MKKIILGALFSALLCACAYADEKFDDILSNSGLTAAADYLQNNQTDPANQFLLGAVQALTGVEAILQERFASYSGQLPMVPGGQTVLRVNPNAKFDPKFVETALENGIGHFSKAQKTLEGVAGQDFVAPINLNSIWFDIDQNGKRSHDEGLSGFLAVLGNMGPTSTGLRTVHFDTADAYWLLAYVHVLQGGAEIVLSVDPTNAIEKVWSGRKRMEEIGVTVRDPFIGDDHFLDTVAIVVTALHGVPEKQRTRAALTHFKSAIEANKSFWQSIEQETDNEFEWIPNKEQNSAFGAKLDPEIAEGWQVVLSEIDAVLNGKALIPFWRVRATGERQVGVNLAKLLNDPGDFDLLLMVHGAALAPYLEHGRVIDQEIFQRFSRATGGQMGLFALWFN